MMVRWEGKVLREERGKISRKGEMVLLGGKGSIQKDVR